MVLGFATLWVVRFFWQCLLGGRLGPPFFPAGKESAAGGVKKGGQGGLPNGPLDDPPTATRGPAGPLFGLSPGVRGCIRERRRRDLHWAAALPCECAVGASCRCFVIAAGQGAALLPVLAWGLVLRWGSSGENGKEFLAFELWGLCAVLLRQRVTSLASRSGEQGRRSSLQERTFVCN